MLLLQQISDTIPVLARCSYGKQLETSGPNTSDSIVPHSVYIRSIRTYSRRFSTTPRKNDRCIFQRVSSSGRWLDDETD